MDYVTLGRTGLKVGVAGLGCGGFSRLGLGTGKSEAEAVAIVRQAMDLGVNLLDTAAAYTTETVVGKAIAGVPRDSVVISTKAAIGTGSDYFPAEAITASLENSLRALGTDHVDIFHLHGISPAAYPHALEVIAPALLREKEKGKIRHLGITETSPNDTGHQMLQRAVANGIWDVVMVGFHMLHQNARTSVFLATQAHAVGTLLMFAVRRIFAQPERVLSEMQALAADGKISPEIVRGGDPLGFLVHASGASSLTDAAYRFVRHEPGVDVVLFGTGDPAHLRTNIASLLKPPLPPADHEKLVALFGHLVGIGLDFPPHSTRTKAPAA